MEREFVPQTESVELAKLGFNEPCLATWVGEVLDTQLQVPSDDYFTQAPLYQQAFRWFREKHNLYGIIIPTVTMYWAFKTMTVVQDEVEVPPYNHVDANDYRTHEEAELSCLRKLIEIVKNK